MRGFTNTTDSAYAPFQELELKEAATCLHLVSGQAHLQPIFPDTKPHECPILPLASAEVLINKRVCT